MEVTLRKASKIRSKVDARLHELSLVLRGTSIQVQAQDNDAEEQLTQMELAHSEALVRFADLATVRYVIRNDVGLANFDNGITSRLNLIEAAKFHLATLKAAYQSADVRLSPEKVSTRIQAARKNIETGRSYGGDNVALSFLTEEQISQLAALVKESEKTVERLTEELETVNGSTRIVLEDRVVQLLKKEEIL